MRDISAHASKRLFNDWVFVCLLQLSNPSFTHSPHCTAHLHIHPSFSSYILLFKQLLILPRPVHPLTPLYLSPPRTFLQSIQSRGERHLSFTPYTPTPPAHNKKKLPVKFNYRLRALAWVSQLEDTIAARMHLNLYIYAFVTFRLRRLSEATRLSKQKTGCV